VLVTSRFELREQGGDLSGHDVGVHLGEGPVVVRRKGAQAGQDATEHLGRDLADLVSGAEQLFHLSMDQLTPLGQLVARSSREVFADAARLGLARAPGQVARLDEVGQAGVNQIDVELDPMVVAQSLRDLPCGQVREQPAVPSVKTRMTATYCSASSLTA
jgi:hypothetical protein